MPCLIQQLFRAKTGLEIDHEVLRDIGFIDILYLEAERRDKIKRESAMNTLNQDIIMTRRALSERSDAYVASSGIISTDSVAYRVGSWNKSFQTMSVEQLHGQSVGIPPMSANRIRQCVPNLIFSELENLGLIDIVNILRTIRHPKIYNRSVGHRNWYYRQLSSLKPYGFRAPAVDRPPMKTQQYQGDDLIIVLEEVDEEEIYKSILDGMQLDEELFGEGREWVGQTIDEIREEIRQSDLIEISEFIERIINKDQSFVWKVERVGYETESGVPWRGTIRESV